MRLFRRSDLGPIALGFWAAAGLLPHLLWLLKRDCVASCIESYPGANDLTNIAEYSNQIAHGASVFTSADPVLRYPPVSLAILAGDVVGPFSKYVVTVGYGFIIEFLLIPIALYLAVRWVADEVASSLSVVLLVFTMHAWFFLPLAATTFGTGNYQYAFAVPTAVLAIGATEWDSRGLWTGALLGLTANIQTSLAALAAVTVAVVYLTNRNLRGTVIAAFVSVVVTIPTFINYATSWTGGQTVDRMMTVSGGLSALFLLILTAALVTASYKGVRFVRRPFHVATMLSSAVALAGLIGGGWWFPFFSGYFLHFAVAAVGAILAAKVLENSQFVSNQFAVIER